MWISDAQRVSRRQPAINRTLARRPASTARQSAATSCRSGSGRAVRGAAAVRSTHDVVAVQRGDAQQAGRDADGGETRVAGLPPRRLRGCRERPAVAHGRADHEACRHAIIEQVNTAFRRIGLIFPLEGDRDRLDLATTPAPPSGACLVRRGWECRQTRRLSSIPRRLHSIKIVAVHWAKRNRHRRPVPVWGTTASHDQSLACGPNGLWLGN